jgi:hypothetical protein
LAALLCAVAATLLGLVAPAGADVFGPISLVSQGLLSGEEQPEQAEYAHDPAIAADGRYIAFDGSIGGVSGVWRAELGRNPAGQLYTTKIEQVAGGDSELPSISAEGRYVSFTTNEGASLAEITDGKPDVNPKPETVNVYRRDMDVPIPASGHCEASQPCPFAVVSAPSGSLQPLSYATTPKTAMTTGSVAIGRSAISADGQEVAFVTTAVSDLVKTEKDELAEAKGEPPPPETPALQVAVRYVEDGMTKLVSGRYEPATATTTAEPVSTGEGNEQYGAVYPGAGMSFTVPPAYGAYGGDPPIGASLSADGSTVAWMGEDVGEQAPLLSGEARRPLYTEPLWRRIEPGSETPTERVTGGSDPENPACVASGETTLPRIPPLSDPCQGPFLTPEESNPPGIMAGGAGSGLSFVPRLSKNGETVAFISRAPLAALGENFGRGLGGQPSDLYVADMRPGLTRDQALTQLTELAGGESAGIADTASIIDFDISPNGEQVAFTTMRTQFPLGSPAYVSAPAAEPGLNELFDADLGDHTLTRVTHGYEGGPSEHPHTPRNPGEAQYEDESDGALSPSFSADGDILVFSSTASNLAWDDGNTPAIEKGGTIDGSDAFVVERQVLGSLPTPSYISPVPPGPALAPASSLSVTALSRADGSVLLYIEVPGSGALRATARSTMPTIAAGERSRATRHARRTGHARGRASRPTSGATAARSHSRPRASVRPRVTVGAQSVATATTLAASGGVATLVLALAKPYASLAAQPGGLSATVNLLFAGSGGGPILRQSIVVTFVRALRTSHHKDRARLGGRRR